MGEYDALSPFVTAWQALEAMLEDGEPFANIETTIEGSQFDEEERAALWLASWAHPSQRRRTLHDAPTRSPRHLAAVD